MRKTYKEKVLLVFPNAVYFALQDYEYIYDSVSHITLALTWCRNADETELWKNAWKNLQTFMEKRLAE